MTININSNPAVALDSPVETSETTLPSERFHVVGIGASAGGLAAFEGFFSGIPIDAELGMAIILVQHLAPDHKSMLSELIRRYTHMPVFEVEDGMPVQPNCVYVIPPNRDMALLNGTLHLMVPAAPHGHRLPIDFFFQSLAQDLRDRAICIVLTGTGSDGTLGIKAIKDGGGMTMAQTPASAEYDSMPRNAVATGLVDYELTPVEMPAQLLAYAANRSSSASSRPATLAPKIESALKKILILVRAQTGHDFSQYKPSTILRRIGRRMTVNQVDSLESYVQYLQQTPSEIESLFRDLLIGVTNFFRDSEAFHELEQQVIPKLFAGKPAGSLIRIWSPGCSTGEEAYSIAILLLEHMETLKQNYTFQIFATDIDSHAIAIARAGLYPASIAADLTPDRLARFFTAEIGSGAYRVHKGIRNMLIFSEQDVIKDSPFSKLDLISCRNLMIYLSGELQQKLISLFHYALNPGGMLFLGTSESVGEINTVFSVMHRKAKLYLRKEASQNKRHTSLNLLLSPIPKMDTALPRLVEKTSFPIKPSLRELTEALLLQHIAPAAALVNTRGDIFYLHGRTGKYLELTPGEAGVNNIIKLAREGLQRELTTALHKAAVSREIVRTLNLNIKTNDHFTTTDLTIRPVVLHSELLAETGPKATSDTPLFLVILEETSANDAALAQQAALHTIALAGNPETPPDVHVLALQQELRLKEEYLQMVNEELEAANEMLKSSSEGMLSANEELQSTNEELETSKEELQSLNEELITVNAELQIKVTDLSRANNDMNNLLGGTGVGTVFVDHQLRILRFTPEARLIINLISGDEGRPVSHIVSNLVAYDHLLSDVQKVLDTLIPKQADVQTTAGKWYTMRILPYRTLDNVIEGAVITFVDITEMMETRAALFKAGALQRAIFNSANFSSIATDAMGVIQIFNVGAEHMLGYAAVDVMNKITPADISDPLEIIARAKALSIELDTKIAPGFEALVFKASRGIEDIYELTYICKDGSRLPAVVSVTALRDKQEAIIGYLLIGTDNTARKQAEFTLQKANELLQEVKFETSEGVR
ncbi:MAG: chemotaxis protein CheB [Gallionellaceae bacterium]|jgi:two-component system CheB/CheR fusion protein